MNENRYIYIRRDHDHVDVSNMSTFRDNRNILGGYEAGGFRYIFTYERGGSLIFTGNDDDLRRILRPRANFPISKITFVSFIEVDVGTSGFRFFVVIT